MAVSGKSGGSGGAIRAGRAYVELSADDKNLRARLAASKQMVLQFGKALAVGAGAAGAGAFAGLFAGANSLINRGTELSRLGAKLGVPVDQLSAFAYAANTTGQSLEDLSGHFENLAERVAQGANGAGEAAETFKRLGIDAGQLKLKNPVDQLIAISEAMASVTNETERLGMLSSLGGDQFQNLNALFKQGPEGIRRLMMESGQVGATMSNQTAANALRSSMAISRAVASVNGAFYSIVEALMPSANSIELTTSLIVALVKVAMEGGSRLSQFADVGFNQLIFRASEASATFKTLLATFRETWGGIADALRAGDLKLAFSISVKGIEIAWKDLLISLTKGWQEFVRGLAIGIGSLLSSVAGVIPSKDLQDAVARLNMFAQAGAGSVGAGTLQGLQADKARLRGEMSALIAEASAKAAATLPAIAGGGGSSSIAKLLGGARGTFSAPNYKAFFGSQGVEQKQLQGINKIAAGVAELNKNAKPLVLQ